MKTKSKSSKLLHKKVTLKPVSLRKLLVEQIMQETVLKYQGSWGEHLAKEQKKYNTDQRNELNKLSNDELVKKYGKIMYDDGVESATYYGPEY